MSGNGTITYMGVVHPWMCDTMGHLNVRHYVGMFDDAAFQLLGRITGKDIDPDMGWADVKMEVEYKDETPVGKLLTVTSRVEKIGSSSITYAHEMRGTLDGTLHATMRTITVRFDLKARTKRPLSDEERKAAEALM